jgi:hypothetical protein
MPLITGVDKAERRSSTKAMRKTADSGVAGRNMVVYIWSCRVFAEGSQRRSAKELWPVASREVIWSGWSDRNGIRGWRGIMRKLI